jgi:cysteinyl-tRNA synthetase
MITINGRKMGKSYNNTITLREMFFGGHDLLERSYPPMTIRFFILQTHYRSTLDFSNEALQAAEKGLQRLLNAYETLDQLKPGDKNSFDTKAIVTGCFAAMNDDFNTAIAIANLFDAARLINSVHGGTETLTADGIAELKKLFDDFLFNILGIQREVKGNGQDVEGLMQLIISIRARARDNKDFQTSDKIRDELAALGIVLKDTKEGVNWSKS